MHDGWQLFSLTLLVEVEESLLKRWVVFYALASVWRRGEREKYTCALAHLTSLGWVWRGVAMRDDVCGRMTCT
jgi:hypothetical protein